MDNAPSEFEWVDYTAMEIDKREDPHGLCHGKVNETMEISIQLFACNKLPK